MGKKILIIGHAQHGKDTLAELCHNLYNLKFKSSSQAAMDIFIYDVLKEKYGYTSKEECFADRVNRRAEWADLITNYNIPDRSKLARGILESSDIYVGMRKSEEIRACRKEGIIDYVIGVYNPRVPLESRESFDIDLWQESDFIIPNAGEIVNMACSLLRLENIFN